MSVTIDLTAGEVRMAGLCLDEVTDASAVAPGALCVQGETVVKPLSYALRATLCARHRSPSTLAPAVLAAATGGSSESPALEALALHLAGADPDRALPGFSDVALVMGRVFGWAPDQLAETPAQWVDDLAASALDVDPGEGHDGWMTYRIDGGGQPDGENVAGLRNRLAADLIRRGAARLTVEAVPNDMSAPHHRATNRPASANILPETAGDLRRAGVEQTDAGATPAPPHSSSDETGTPPRVAVKPGPAASTVDDRSAPDTPSAPDPRAPVERVELRSAVTSEPSAPMHGAVAPPAVPPTARGSASVGSNGATRSGVQLRPRPDRPSAIASPVTTVHPIETRSVTVGREHPAAASGRGDPGSRRSAHARPTAETRHGSATVDMVDASLADRVAQALHDECDLRGILRW